MNLKEFVGSTFRTPGLFLKLTAVRRHIYKVIGNLSAVYSVTSEPVRFNDRLKLNYKPIKVGEDWGGLFDCAWFEFKGEVPDKYLSSDVHLIIDIDGEGCIYDADGAPVKGLAKTLNVMDAFNTIPGKKVYKLQPVTKTVDIWVETGNNGWDGKSTGQSYLKHADIVVRDIAAYNAYFDYLTLYFLFNSASAPKERRAEVLDCLRKANAVIKKYTPEEFIRASEIMSVELSKKTPAGDKFEFYATGHAHLDLAWLWPVRETKRKAARTFSNQLKLIEDNKDYVFGASQPQQFQWMKDMYPKLYGRLKKAVESGGLEAQGGMWVEADTNVTGGESLVRQMLYGKRFFMKEFGKDMKVLWLPDVFGFSGALPQLIKKAGMDYFLTIKLSWNEHNKFPHHSFIWEGIDDSSVLVHMPPEGTYNSEAFGNAIWDAYNKYREKQTDCSVLLYGVGDGGGGPSEAHYEVLKREQDLAGLKKVKLSPAVDFFERLDGYKEHLPRFKGELYLEKHQGTLTTQGRNKMYNRKIEYALKNAELLAVCASLKGYEYPKELFERIWKEVLLYQFHDIIPGSSITRVYTESVMRYRDMLGELETETGKILDYLGKGKAGVTAVNTSAFPRTEWVKDGQEWLYFDLKPFSAAKPKERIIEDSLKCGADFIENDKVKVVFSEDGFIKSVVVKADGYEYAGEYMNRLNVYYDKKLHYNAWDIDINYVKHQRGSFKLVSSESFKDGPTVVMRNNYTYGKSRLSQDVVLTEGKEAVVFKTWADWHETHKMLRTEFRPSVYAPKVLCNIQWGNIERTTATDNSVAYAQYEICAHKFIDVSTDIRGVSLMNDCKYGHRVKDGLISLNLLRSPVFPDKTADRGEHYFTYALYPHMGGAFESGLVAESYALNDPLIVSGSGAAFESMFTSNAKNVVVETVKLAEEGSGVIVRLYECEGKPANAKITTSIKHAKAYECDLLENAGAEADLSALYFKPYEIKTILLSGDKK